MAKGLR
jgi:hypothetical protein